jgi:hypothetical protein
MVWLQDTITTSLLGSVTAHCASHQLLCWKLIGCPAAWRICVWSLWWTPRFLVYSAPELALPVPLLGRKSLPWHHQQICSPAVISGLLMVVDALMPTVMRHGLLSVQPAAFRLLLLLFLVHTLSVKQGLVPSLFGSNSFLESWSAFFSMFRSHIAMCNPVLQRSIPGWNFLFKVCLSKSLMDLTVRFLYLYCQ